MPHGSIYFPEPEYTKEDISRFMSRLADIAERFGFITAGGVKGGRGSIRRLLEAIVNGEVRCVETDKFAHSITPTTEEGRVTLKRLEGELHRLDRLKNDLIYARRVAKRQEVWCCEVDLYPHTAGLCPMHPGAEQIPLEQAIRVCEHEIADVLAEITHIDLHNLGHEE